MKPLVISFLVCLFICSCNQVELNKIDVDKAIEKEFEQFSIHQIDIFPSFKSCQTNEEKEATKACFTKTMHLHLANFFEEKTIPDDSLNVYMFINSKGMMQVKHIDSKQNTKTSHLKTELNTYLKENLPTIYPAQKQGIPVNCKLMLPVVFKTDTLNLNENL